MLKFKFNTFEDECDRINDNHGGGKKKESGEIWKRKIGNIMMQNDLFCGFF